MEKVYIGKIVNTFGIKGELKVANHFEFPEKVFKKDMKILIDDEQCRVTSVRYHKNHYLVGINELDNINLVLKYKGQNIFVLKEELMFEDDEYMMEELIDLNVYDGNELIGQVTEVINNEVNPIIKVNDQFYIPIKANYIIKVDLKNKRIDCQNIKELML